MGRPTSNRTMSRVVKIVGKAQIRDQLLGGKRGLTLAKHTSSAPARTLRKHSSLQQRTPASNHYKHTVLQHSHFNNSLLTLNLPMDSLRMAIMLLPLEAPSLPTVNRQPAANLDIKRMIHMVGKEPLVA